MAAKKTTKSAPSEAPVKEQDVTAAALEAASEEQTIINEKRETAAESVLAVDSSKIYEDSLSETNDAPRAKAGKRSTKAQREAAEEEARLARKVDGEEAGEKPKQPKKPTRSRLARRGKRFQAAAKHIEAGKFYTLDDGIALAKEINPASFDASVELHINLSVDPRHADQNIRDNLVLPAGTGKAVRIAVLSDDPAAAKTAGADIAGNDDFLAQLEKGLIDFDILIATPTLMAKLGKYARMLGPRGLMPNPKSGTVTTDIQKAIQEAKAGRIEYRVDSTGIIHVAIGKVSFTKAQLLENAQALLASIKNNKPASVKGSYFKTAHLTTTMGPSIRIDIASINA